MEYALLIYCIECTKAKRAVDKYYPPINFTSLNSAVEHINITGHEVKIELEIVSEED